MIVWSHSKQTWLNGHIKVYISMIRCVIVKYEKTEKLMGINSKEIKLFNA